MKDITYSIREPFNKGLRPSKRNPRNSLFLVESIGAVPRDSILQALEQLTRVDTSSLGALSFPYPQIFILTHDIIVCKNDAIYEFTAPATFTLGIGSLTVGTTWSCADYQMHLLFTNGRQMVKRDAVTRLWSVDTSIPFGTCILNFNQQTFIGSPNVNASGAI